MNIPARNQVTSVEAHERDNIEVPDIPTTTVATMTTSITTPPIPLDVDLIGTSSPRISLPEGSPSCPTVTATCRPRTWMQQLTEGQINEPRREDAGSSEDNTSVVETLPEEISDELGHEWRVLHLFDPPGVRFPTDTTPPNQRRLAENDALVEQQSIWMMCPPGDKETTDFTHLNMVILFIEGEVEEEVEEVEEEESGFRKDE